MNCQVCGVEMVAGAQFCGSCGAPVVAPTVTAATPPPAGVPGGAVPPGMPGATAPPGPPLPPYPGDGSSGSGSSDGSNKGLLYGIVAAVVVALLGIGAFLVLGGDDDDDTATDTTTSAPPESTTSTTEAEDQLTLADWAEQADDACSDAREGLEDFDEEPESDEEIAAFLEVAVEATAQLNDDLEGLGLPDEKAEEVEALLAILAGQQEAFEDVQAAAEEGDLDPWETLLTEGYADEEESAELAEELGLEDCFDTGTDDPSPTSEVPPTTSGGSGDEPFTYGDDPALDALWDDCADGSADACDELWTTSPANSEYEEFGYSCGGVVPEGEAEICSDVLGGGGDAPPDGDPFTFGDDAALDALWTACSGGDGQACDDLFYGSPIDSEYETFGNTCGYRYSEDDVPLSCAAVL